MVVSTFVTDPRNSRYHPASSPPPDLRSVHKEIARFLKRKQRGSPDLVGLSKHEVRTVAGSASREYKERGPADDLVRFLETVGTIIESPTDADLFYFDPDRAPHVEQCCELRKIPSTNYVSVEDRIEGLRQKARAMAANATMEGDADFDTPTGTQRLLPAPPPPAPFQIPDEGQISALPLMELKPLLKRLLDEEAEAQLRADQLIQRRDAAAAAASKVKAILDQKISERRAQAEVMRLEADRLMEEAAKKHDEAVRMAKELEDAT